MNSIVLHIMSNSWVLVKSYQRYDEALKEAENQNVRIEKNQSTLIKTVLICKHARTKPMNCGFRVNF